MTEPTEPPTTPTQRPRRTPICHRTLGQQDGHPTGAPCIGSACSAWYDHESNRGAPGPFKHAGFCRDVDGMFRDEEMWVDPQSRKS